MGKGKLTQNKVHLEEHEYQTVKLLLEEGHDIELIPPSNIKGYHSPDIVMDGTPWEMKAPIGNGKYTAQNIIQAAAQQSGNIIIDLRRCKMPEDKAINAFKREFSISKRMKVMKIINKNGEILDFPK